MAYIRGCILKARVIGGGWHIYTHRREWKGGGCSCVQKYGGDTTNC